MASPDVFYTPPGEVDTSNDMVQLVQKQSKLDHKPLQPRKEEGKQQPQLRRRSRSVPAPSQEKSEITKMEDPDKSTVQDPLQVQLVQKQSKLDHKPLQPRKEEGKQQPQLRRRSRSVPAPSQEKSEITKMEDPDKSTVQDPLQGRSFTEDEVRNICAAVWRDQLADLAGTLVGPPGPPGQSRPGKPGPPETKDLQVTQDRQACQRKRLHRSSWAFRSSRSCGSTR
ncbi:unnamed protein product [Callosobruchus maculatus]|uniref:Uncharacterized protein n=1 Tax=Callosobruchus maculatus TaxID=64391 RepID=A0A653CUM9_CALMS|nr:unnamed protein product [Callosobruchus maculatus]